MCCWCFLFCSCIVSFPNANHRLSWKVFCVCSLQAAGPAVERPAGVDRAQGKHTFSGGSVCVLLLYWSPLWCGCILFLFIILSQCVWLDNLKKWLCLSIIRTLCVTYFVSVLVCFTTFMFIYVCVCVCLCPTFPSLKPYSNPDQGPCRYS